MLSNMSANASVARARKMPPSRNAGIASSAPTMAAIAAPITMVSSTGMSKRSASWAVPNDPTAANDAWQSEICPAIPVITVIDRKMSEKITALVMIRSQKLLTTNNATYRPMAMTTAPSVQVE